eukprot:25885_1
MIYHCPKWYHTLHEKGYNLCPKCADKKVIHDQKNAKIKVEHNVEQEQNHVKENDSMVVCSCGAKMAYVETVKAYNGGEVVCDKCKDIVWGTMVYHCTIGN